MKVLMKPDGKTPRLCETCGGTLRVVNTLYGGWMRIHVSVQRGKACKRIKQWKAAQVKI